MREEKGDKDSHREAENIRWRHRVGDEGWDGDGDGEYSRVNHMR